MIRLRGKVAVTGGATGIGQACVRALVEAGATAISIDLKINPACTSIVSDVAEEGDLAAAFKKVGPLDGLICAAETQANTGLRDMCWEHWQEVMAINVRGPMLSMKHANLKKNSGIVLVSSALAHQGSEGQLAYSVSKGALLGLMRASSGEFALQNIRVNAISPKSFCCSSDKTGVAISFNEKQRSGQSSNPQPAGQECKLDEMANCAVFLLSKNAQFITGTELIVDS